MTIKQKLIDEYLAKPYEVGERVEVMGLGRQDKKQWGNSAEIKTVKKDGVEIMEYSSLKFVPFDMIRKNTYNVGLDPFDEDLLRNAPRSVNFTLESVYYTLFRDRSKYHTDKGFSIGTTNWNPFVELNGKKEYYQRDLVWTLEDKQLLLESIYNGIACGSVVVRKRSFKWLDKRDQADECFFMDIVDGKQRMSTIHEFINDGFPDFEGRYYSDFSRNAQHKLTNHQLFAYFEFDESASDQSVLQQFLKVNFTGKPQSKEHIEFVKNLLK